jgi:hypothetical protein
MSLGTKKKIERNQVSVVGGFLPGDSLGLKGH